MPEELRAAKAAARQAKLPSERVAAAASASQLQSALQRVRERELAAEVDREWRASTKAAVAKGKRPFYLKDSDRKRRVLERKYEALAEAGKLESYIAKRRKRVASKDRKRLPFNTRPTAGA